METGLKPFFFYQQIEDYSLKYIDVIYASSKENALKQISPRIKTKISNQKRFFCIESLNKHLIEI